MEPPHRCRAVGETSPAIPTNMVKTATSIAAISRLLLRPRSSDSSSGETTSRESYRRSRGEPRCSLPSRRGSALVEKWGRFGIEIARSQDPNAGAVPMFVSTCTTVSEPPAGQPGPPGTCRPQGPQEEPGPMGPQGPQGSSDHHQDCRVGHTRRLVEVLHQVSLSTRFGVPNWKPAAVLSSRRVVSID